MSRLHNLFHGSSTPDRSSTGAAGIETLETPPAGATSTSATALLSDFAVEVAQVGPEQRLVFHTEPRSPAADRFRLLRMRLKEQWQAGKLKKLLITGPLAGEGKSTVSLNLATALAERGKRKVLLIEADLHNSGLTHFLKLKPWAGLAECLADETQSPLSSIRRIDPLGWYLLPAGEPRRNATELLQTPALGHIMEQLSECFDWVLIDSPPVIPLSDSISLQQHAQATLLVVRAGQTPREAVEQTIALLGEKNIWGIVLNAVEARDPLYYQYYEGTQRHADD